VSSKIDRAYNRLTPRQKDSVRVILQTLGDVTDPEKETGKKSITERAFLTFDAVLDTEWVNVEGLEEYHNQNRMIGENDIVEETYDIVEAAINLIVDRVSRLPVD